MSRDLNAREYKLLLAPEPFAGLSAAAQAAAFWEGSLLPAIGTVGSLGDAILRARERLDCETQRIVRYFDTADCVLTSADYALRVRTRADRPDDAKAGVTLKLRKPDFYIVASTSLPGRSRKSTLFEEDIAPMEVLPADAGNDAKIVAPKRKSAYSRYALSARHSLPPGESLRALGDAFGLFETLKENLTAAGVKARSREPLRSGPKIREHVFKGAKVKLGSGLAAGFALTLWYWGDEKTRPRVAEISYKCPVSDGAVSAAAARRASDLFLVLQDKLPVDFRHTSKTALAVPRGCMAL